MILYKWRTTSWFQVFVKYSANKQQQRLYGMYDVINVLLFILYTGLENLIIDESCKTCKSRSYYKPHVCFSFDSQYNYN